MSFYDLMEKLAYLSTEKPYSRRNLGKIVIVATASYFISCSKKQEKKESSQNTQAKEPEKKDSLDDYLSTLTNEDP